MPSIRLFLLSLFCCFVFAGCGGDALVPISGNVTFDGVPVEEGTITFMPETGTGTSGSAPISNGRYSVRVEPGRMIVQIFGLREPTPADQQIMNTNPMGGSPMMSDRPPLFQFIPMRYNLVTELRADIQGARRDLDFDLTP